MIFDGAISGGILAWYFMGTFRWGYFCEYFGGVSFMAVPLAVSSTRPRIQRLHALAMHMSSFT